MTPHHKDIGPSKFFCMSLKYDVSYSIKAYTVVVYFQNRAAMKIPVRLPFAGFSMLEDEGSAINHVFFRVFVFLSYNRIA